MADTATHPTHDPDALHRKYLEERDKRLGRDRSAQFVDAVGEFRHFIEDPHVEPGFARDAIDEEIDVAVIGGGFGGLLTAASLRDRGVDSFRIIEQAGDFGGTWYWNRYPGIRCDIESYIYMPLLEEVGTVPTERYAHGTEIFAHCQAIGRHYDLYDRALFQTNVTRIAWDDRAARWIIATHRGDTIRARFVTVSQGPLTRMKLPAIPGISDFRGKMFHTARWDYEYTGGTSKGGQTKLADKRVAVIGTGATGVQIVPTLAHHAKHLYLFQRTPSAIDTRGNRPTDIEWFKSQPSGWLKARMDNFLAVITGIPVGEDVVADGWTDFWMRFGKLMHDARASGDTTPPPALMQRVDYAKMEELRARIDEQVTCPRKAESLKPWYNYLCKRPLYSDDFFEALNRDNVSLVDTQGRGVERITDTGIVANGEEYAVDCIIFATGFDVGAAAHTAGGYEVVGRNGVTLAQKWSDGVRSVHGTQVSGFPNFHIVGGVAQGTIAFNFTHTLSMQAKHATNLISRCLADGIATMEVTAEAEDRWLQALEAKHVDHQQFYEDCTPGFLNNEGDFKDRPTFVGGTYGGGPLEYDAVLADWRQNGIGNDTVVSAAG